MVVSFNFSAKCSVHAGACSELSEAQVPILNDADHAHHCVLLVTSRKYLFHIPVHDVRCEREEYYSCVCNNELQDLYSMESAFRITEPSLQPLTYHTLIAFICGLN